MTIFAAALLAVLCTARARADVSSQALAIGTEVAPTAAASGADAAGPSAAALKAASAVPEDVDLISDGSRISLRKGDFTIKPPLGWEVYTHHPQLTLLMQVPYKPGMKYQRTIQVASFAGPRYIDEVTAKEYEQLIVRKFSVASASIQNYHVRNHMAIELADGRPGLLFYSEFVLDGVSLMQAHILVSDKHRHYLMTFTDVAEHFENNDAGQFLTEAWDSMISVELATATPSRFGAAIVIMIGVGVLLLLLLVGWGVSRWRANRSYRDYVDDAGQESDATSEAPKSFAAESTFKSGEPELSIQEEPLSAKPLDMPKKRPVPEATRRLAKKAVSQSGSSPSTPSAPSAPSTPSTKNRAEPGRSGQEQVAEASATEQGLEFDDEDDDIAV